MRPVINVLRSKRWTFVLFVIIAVLLVGIVIWIRRRYR